MHPTSVHLHILRDAVENTRSGFHDQQNLPNSPPQRD